MEEKWNVVTFDISTTFNNSFLSTYLAVASLEQWNMYMGRVPYARRCQTNTFHFSFVNVGNGIEFHHLASIVCSVDLISVTQCVVWRVSPSSYPNDTHISHTPPSAGCCPQAHLPRPDTIRCPVELSTNLHQVSQALTGVLIPVESTS